MTVKDLKNNEYHAFYSTYINMVPENITLMEGYKDGGTKVIEFFKSIPNEKLDYKYAKGKWTVKEVLQHIIDNERVFTYRCFRISRRDITLLAGYNENDYVASSKANKKTMQTLLQEYKIGRKNSMLLIESLSQEDLCFMGNLNGSCMSARAAAFVTLGHEIHHLNVLKTRYL